MNLLMLGYFKYAGFLTGGRINSLMLPVGISFYLFMSCGYLVDVYYEEIEQTHFLNYCLFISFFPQLIAGPIVTYNEMIPQFEKKKQQSLYVNI